MHQLKIVVVGAGLGGLTAGIALTRAGYEVDVYERAPEIQPIGAGISLWPNGVKVLDWLGLGREIERLGAQLEWLHYRDRDGELLTEIAIEPLVQAAGEHVYPVARGDLQLLLRDVLGSASLTLDAECVGVEQDAESAAAVFADGRRARGDVVIGADGVRSVVRSHVAGETIVPRYAGHVNWNGLMPASADLNPERAFTIYVGERKRVGVMPVGGSRLYVFFDVPMPEGTTVPRDEWTTELRAAFAGWVPPVQEMIDRLELSTTVRLDVYDLDPLERLVNGRVALLGDAAHASTPTLGQGAAQAMEDAETLTRVLLTTNIGVADALQRYEQERKGRAQAVSVRSRERTDVICGKDADATELWYATLRTGQTREVIESLTDIVVAGPLR